LALAHLFGLDGVFLFLFFDSSANALSSGLELGTEVDLVDIELSRMFELLGKQLGE
jgi:hypothetical protein